ncbi:MAG: phosphoethanolamine transferase [Polaromonas sp.]|nr:phosphoethanolamine transferase [Polaromonas sp.]
MQCNAMQQSVKDALRQPAEAARMQIMTNKRLALYTAALGLALIAWDFSGFDLVLAHLSGNANGFPLRENWFLVQVLHEGARRVAWLLVLGLCLCVWWWPGQRWSHLPRLPFSQRLQLAVTPLLAAAVVSLIKSFSAISCPWSLADFGGIAHYSAHWRYLLQPDGGSGGCFPAGHAVSGFAFVGGYFAWRRHSALVARRWLAGAVLAGLFLGVAQQLRGAHFMSHTLWSGWICWCVAWALDAAWPYLCRLASTNSAAGAAPATGELALTLAVEHHTVRAVAGLHGATWLRHPLWLLLAAGTWMALPANLSLWQALADILIPGKAAWAFETGMAVMIAAALTALLSLAAWRWTLKPALILTMLMASCGAYFMTSYHVVIDSAMLVNALHTDAREVRDLLSARLLGFLLVLWVVPSIVVWRWPVVYGHWMRRAWQNLATFVAAVVVVGMAVLASFNPLSSTMRNHHELRYRINPLNTIYALGQLAAVPLRRNESVIEPLGLDARIAMPAAGARPPLLVLVLGETGRSGNFSVNGYARSTTPELARQDIASFTNAWSCGTSTAASVPCMFSNLGRSGYEARSRNTEGLLDVIQHAGMAVLWLDNQSGCKGVCDRVPSVSTANLQDAELCPNDECFDAIMLKGLEQRIASLPAERRAKGVVLVLHQMGSHGPAYHLRSPRAFKRFMPECADNYLQNCSAEELTNAYDNTVAYTDHVLASAIDWLKAQQGSYAPALMFVADHGESLGEHNLYLHGLPYLIAPDVQKHVPWITWFSGGFTRQTGISSACLRAHAHERVTHDQYFHSVLGLLQINSASYDPRRNAYAACAVTPLAPDAAAPGLWAKSEPVEPARAASVKAARSSSAPRPRG